MNRKRGCQFLMTLGALLTIAMVTLGWWLLSPRSIVDDTPLPSGQVLLPEIDSTEASSRIFIGVSMSINSLEKAANQFTPRKKNIDEGTITRGNIDFYRSSSNRIGINMDASFDGKLKWGIWKVNSAEVSLDRSSISLDLDRDWKWKCDPNFCAEIEEIDVDWAPDKLVKWVVNDFFVPKMQKDFLGDFSFLPLKPFAQSAWNESNIDLVALEAPRIHIGCHPTGVFIGGPSLDERTNDLIVNLGIDLQSWCSLGVDGSPVAAGSSSLPQLQQTDLQQKTTELSIPLLFKISELADLFQPQSLEVNGGRVRVERLELSEAENTVHARLHAEVQLPPSKWQISNSKSTKIILVMQAKPSCNSITGEIRLENLVLTPRSDSILVDLLGNGASVVLKEQISLLLPPLSGSLINKWESVLNHEAEGFISRQMIEWAKAAPAFAPQIQTITPTIKNIRVAPKRIAAETGHLVVILKASADLNIHIK